MKKLYILVTILSLSCLNSWAQKDTASSTTNWVATPNPGFEDWTTVSGILGNYYTPDGWDCANSQTAYTGTYCVTEGKGANVKSGTYSAELITQDITIASTIAPGVITTGTLPTSASGTITGGIAYTLRPDSIVGWFKYTPQGSDYCYISFTVFGTSNTDTVGVASYSTTAGKTISSFTRFSAPMVYRNSHSVTNSIWVITSSNASAPVTGSTMYVDDVAVIINTTTGINEQVNTAAPISINPNPASDHVIVSNTSNHNAVLALYDITGRKVAEQSLACGTNNIDVKAFTNGLYLYTVTDENGGSLKTGKLIIQK